MATGMDVDNRSLVSGDRMGRMGFARSDELSVSFYAHLPVEVKQVLKNAGE